VVCIPVAGIESGQVTAQRFVTMELQSFRVAQNCGTTAFFAAHEDTSTLRVFAWPEGQDVPTSTAVGVARWIGGNGYQSRTPDGRRWLDRADPRITGATLAGQELWFAWGVDRGSNQRPKPFVQIARLDARNMTLLENINLFDPDSAICYAALATNADNEIGVSYMIGGGARFPSHVVGILTGTRKEALVAAGDRGPLLDPQTGKGEWGDYLTVRPVFPSRKLFAATGYRLKGRSDGENLDATPRFVTFGRAGDAGTPPPDGGGANGGTSDHGPITDVNSLPTVSAAVAAAIKAAAGIRLGPGVPHAEAAAMPLRQVTGPGRERWPVKTGTDEDVAKVGKNVIGGHPLQAGIVPTTVEELISIPPPPEMPDPTRDNPAFQARRSEPVETTIWRVEADIIAVKLEADGDYHLVLQGASGETMIGEIPTPTVRFVDHSPWMADISQARQAVDDKLVQHLAPTAFVPLGDRLVPRESLSVQPPVMPAPPASFQTPPEEQEATVPPFKTRVSPTPARITGVGFFDRVHGQMGVSQSNGIELHPILQIEWL
jgi:hypothetical protein